MKHNQSGFPSIIDALKYLDISVALGTCMLQYLTFKAFGAAHSWPITIATFNILQILYLADRYLDNYQNPTFSGDLYGPWHGFVARHPYFCFSTIALNGLSFLACIILDPYSPALVIVPALLVAYGTRLLSKLHWLNTMAFKNLGTAIFLWLLTSMPIYLRQNCGFNTADYLLTFAQLVFWCNAMCLMGLYKRVAENNLKMARYRFYIMILFLATIVITTYLCGSANWPIFLPILLISGMHVVIGFPLFWQPMLFKSRFRWFADGLIILLGISIFL